MKKIGSVRNNFGALYAKQEGEKFYMSIEDPEGFEWHEIPKSLYEELIKFQDGE